MSDYELDFDDEDDDFRPLELSGDDDFRALDFDDDEEYRLDFDDDESRPMDLASGDDEDIEGDFRDDIEFRPERDVFDRVGMFGSEPTERFYKVAEAISLDLNERVTPSPFSDRDLELIKVTNVPFYEFKNPTAYVLGYLGSSKKRGITKSSIDYVFKNILPKIEDTSVKKPDVIRYSRLWETL